MGGPSRNGKTTLIKAINSHKGKVAGLPVEGLLDRFYYHRYLSFNSSKDLIIREYLQLERYTDEKRKESTCPGEYIHGNIEDISARIEDKRHHIEIIFDLLAEFAHGNDAESWAVCDLHPERIFGMLKQYCPNLHLIIMLRDPREAICANLHWRTFPRKRDNPRQVLEYHLLLWAFSAINYHYWKNRYPDDVTVFSFNALLDKNSAQSLELSRLVGINPDSFSALLGTTPSYTFEGVKHLTPYNEWKELLTDKELALIELLEPYAARCGNEFYHEVTSRTKNNEGMELKTKLEKMDSLCSLNPIAAKKFIEIQANGGTLQYYLNLSRYKFNEIKHSLQFMCKSTHPHPRDKSKAV